MFSPTKLVSVHGGSCSIDNSRPIEGELACLDFIYSPLGENTVFIDVEVFSEGALFLAKSYVYDMRGDTLGLGDTSGRRQIFTKMAAPPEGSECIRLDATVVAEHIEADPRFGTGLVSDGTDLWFGANKSSDEVLVSVNPLDGMVGTPLVRPSGLVNVHAYDGSLFWLRHTSGIIAVGHDIDLEAMSWGGDSLWAIFDESPSPIVEIDIDTQEVIETYEIPGYSPISHAYQGLAVVGDDVYVLLEEQLSGSRQATIVRVTP